MNNDLGINGNGIYFGILRGNRKVLKSFLNVKNFKDVVRKYDIKFIKCLECNIKFKADKDKLEEHLKSIKHKKNCIIEEL